MANFLISSKLLRGLYKMHAPLSTELFWLTLTITMTALIWMPYIVNRIIEHGVWPALTNPQPDLRPKAQWAERLMRAHDNAVENLIIFAPLVLILQVTGTSTTATTNACMIYFFVRLSHLVIYTLAIPFFRTLAFLAGFICQMVLAFTVLGVM